MREKRVGRQEDDGLRISRGDEGEEFVGFLMNEGPTWS